MSSGQKSEFPDTLSRDPADKSAREVSPWSAERLPAKIGRYRVIESLGSGGFGRVFKAHDEELQRLVAIKVPIHVVQSHELESYREEARTLARLNHPNLAQSLTLVRTSNSRYSSSRSSLMAPACWDTSNRKHFAWRTLSSLPRRSQMPCTMPI